MLTRWRQPSFNARSQALAAAISGRRPVEGVRTMIEGVSVFALVVVAFVLVTLMMGVRQVPQGYDYTVERFGRYYKTLTPGLGLIMPLIDSIGAEST